MKILITGYTPRMYGSKRLRMDYQDISTFMELILREMGHEVEKRKVIIGEEINHVYDYAFCGLAPLSSIMARMIPETHYVMDTMEGRHSVFAEDFSFVDYGNTVRYTLDRWDKYLKYKNFPCKPHEIEETKKSLDRMISMNCSLNNAPALMPMFPWGDHSKLMEGNYKAGIVPFDPARWISYPTVDVPSFEEKKKQWVMAALSDHSSWINRQKFNLPIRYVGNRRKHDGIVLSEADTVQLFADSFGVLSSGYKSAGSGWWRARYLHAAWAESPIYCDHEDGRSMDDSFLWYARELEALATDKKGYLELVDQQNTWLQEHISTKEEVFATFERLMLK